MKIHFIAIGGSIMHSMAIALKAEGHEITGSDDQIYDPAKSRLAAHDLLPENGWNEDRIKPDLDAVILGMHAFEDNPELAKAKELGVPIYSFPEFVYQQSVHKHRIVIAGSAGKTTVTSMIMHVLRACGREFDYLVGAQVEGFDNPVKLTESAPVLIVEGDEYLASRIDPRPKFLLYQAHMIVITNISWDHINVFPDEENYVGQFRNLLKEVEKAADVIYWEDDKRLSKIINDCLDPELHYIHPYKTPKNRIKNGKYSVQLDGQVLTPEVFGDHNMANIAAAWSVCELLGIEKEDFATHIATFKGAQIRLETIHEDNNKIVFRDYAHAPNKVQATVKAIKKRYPDRQLIACYELHTFSSLNKEFLPRYKGSLDEADRAIVYLNPKALEKRRMDPIQKEEIKTAFHYNGLEVVFDASQIPDLLGKWSSGNDAYAIMSSGNFDSLDFRQIFRNMHS